MKLDGVKIVNKEGELVDLSYATKYSAGFDIYASDKTMIYPNKKALVPTGLFLKVDKDKVNCFFELQIRPRSSLSYNTDLRICNSPGTIDMDYEGEIMIIIEQTRNRPHMINEGDPIAQGVFCPVLRPDCIVVQEKERKTGGFGSTEKKKVDNTKKPKPKKR